MWYTHGRDEPRTSEYRGLSPRLRHDKLEVLYLPSAAYFCSLDTPEPRRLRRLSYKLHVLVAGPRGGRLRVSAIPGGDAYPDGLTVLRICLCKLLLLVIFVSALWSRTWKRLFCILAGCMRAAVLVHHNAEKGKKLTLNHAAVLVCAAFSNFSRVLPM